MCGWPAKIVRNVGGYLDLTFIKEIPTNTIAKSSQSTEESNDKNSDINKADESLKRNDAEPKTQHTLKSKDSDQMSTDQASYGSNPDNQSIGITKNTNTTAVDIIHGPDCEVFKSANFRRMHCTSPYLRNVGFISRTEGFR